MKRKQDAKFDRAARSSKKQIGTSKDNGAKKRKLNANGESPRALVNMSTIHGVGDSTCQPEKSSIPFPYKPLDPSKLEIRVVTLKPGTGSAPIECTIRHVARNAGCRPIYSALSYTWGPPDIVKMISLQGIKVQVRENLWQALYHLRSSDKELRLWIDAICINQNDISERNEQVSRMGTIYGAAKEVLVWLGPEEGKSHLAMAFIENMSSSRVAALPFRKDPSYQAEWRAIKEFTQRDYWKRLWIIQEVFRAPKITVHCGRSVLKWADLALFFRRLRPGNARLCKSLPARLTQDRTSQSHSLYELLETYKDSLCADPRDKVYGLIGLAGRRLYPSGKPLRAGVEWITVDYSRSAWQLFRSLTVMYSGHYNRKYSLIRLTKLLYDVLDIAAPFSRKNPVNTAFASGGFSTTLTGRSQTRKALTRHGFSDKSWSVRYIDSSWYGTSTNGKDIWDRIRGILAHNFPEDAGRPTFASKIDLPDTFERDIERLRTFAWLQRLAGSFEDKVVLDQSSKQGSRTSKVLGTPPHARPFLTHNGQLGFAACEIKEGDSIYHLIELRIALVVDTSRAKKENAVAKGELANYVRGRALVMELDELREDFFIDDYFMMDNRFRAERLSHVLLKYKTESADGGTKALSFTMFLEQWRYLAW